MKLSLLQVALLGLAGYAFLTWKRKPTTTVNVQVGPDKPIVSGETVVG